MIVSTLLARSRFLLVFCAFAALMACADEAGDVPEPDSGSNVIAASGEGGQNDVSLDFESAEPAQEHIATSTKRGTIAAMPPLSLGSFLSRSDAQDFIPNTPLDEASLPGQRVTSNYNAVRYTPREDGGFGLALQVWSTETNDAATERVAALREQFLNVADAPQSALPEGAFTSERAGIRTLVFRSTERAYAFALSCELDHCRNWRPLIELGESIAKKQ
ncbi:hypothetical protein DV096_18995 [Bradymonadaceae bacterium TMQ3]|uniref:Uncharacterized protein n=1 Tax=Lujinxingia sediminis TaxID=2480984 RepID=A0ABY0CPJ3_9DELT|nr:hypothetical protein [Lujinxingia sediminis]RDV36540.1 hypothetical protein DV096_18995 [Bradymonadaceae bacterium TMQ3]RVU42391.1 hypothetical protein EA187_16060 [Lujinxingia sediminis]TXC74590.1 hypothetical protein FRC91_15880 [Bradymonadales bacterium TMQ1]